MKDVDVVIARGESLRQLASSVGTVVVCNENMYSRQEFANAFHEMRQ
jgi:hypothetical protein